MHSTIIQISKKPIFKESFIKEDNHIIGYFLETVAEYVYESNNIIEDYNYFCEYLNIGRRDNQINITTEKVKSFFEKKYMFFKNIIKSLDDFCDKNKTYLAKKTLEEKNGFYIYYQGDDYNELMTLDEFMRRNLEGGIFYLGNTMNYKF